MKCNECIEILSAYLDGQLSEEEVKVVEAHLAECKLCQKTLNHLKLIISGLHNSEEVEVPEPFHQDLMERLKNESLQTKQQIHMKKTKIPHYIGYVGGLAVALVATFFILPKSGPSMTSMPPHESAEVKSNGRMMAGDVGNQIADEMPSAQAVNPLQTSGESQIEGKAQVELKEEVSITTNSVSDKLENTEVPSTETYVVRSDGEVHTAYWELETEQVEATVIYLETYAMSHEWVVSYLGSEPKEGIHLMNGENLQELLEQLKAQTFIQNITILEEGSQEVIIYFK